MAPEARRRLYLWVAAVGLVLCLLFSLFGWASPWETRYVFPALSLYLVLALCVLMRNRGSLAVVERSGFWVLAVVWLGSMAIGLSQTTDDRQAWDSLSPGVFMNMTLLVVLAHLWYGTTWALVASLLVPVASAVIGVVRFWGNGEFLGLLFQYEGYVIVIAAFTYVLARSRDSLLVSQIDAERMRVLAFEDSLTGLPNRRRVGDRLRALLAEEHSPDLLSVISFDLDDFKRINDTYGHDTGDRVLRGVAHLSRQRVPRDAMLGRWGGDEFLVLLPGVGRDRAMHIAEGLRLALAGYEHDEGLSVTASFGVMEAPVAATVEEVLHVVDNLLYRAKRSGRDRVAAAAPLKPTPMTLVVGGAAG